jgi:hypothetical protein
MGRNARLSLDLVLAYRVAAPRRRSVSLFAVRLTGGTRSMHRALALVRVALAAAALVAYFLPWHAVHMAGTELEGLNARPTFTCSGWSHVATLLPVAALLGTIFLAGLAFRWPRLSAALTLPTITLGALAAIRYATDNDLHHIDRVIVLPGQRVFSAVWLALVLAAVLDLLVVPMLYAVTRARLARAHGAASIGGSIAGGAGGGSGA